MLNNQAHPFQVQLNRKKIGHYATAEEGALMYARALGLDASASKMALREAAATVATVAVCDAAAVERESATALAHPEGEGVIVVAVVDSMSMERQATMPMGLARDNNLDGEGSEAGASGTSQ